MSDDGHGQGAHDASISTQPAVYDPSNPGDEVEVAPTMERPVELEPIGPSPPFSSLVHILERVRDIQGTDKKRASLANFFKHWRERAGPDLARVSSSSTSLLDSSSSCSVLLASFTVSTHQAAHPRGACVGVGQTSACLIAHSPIA